MSVNPTLKAYVRWTAGIIAAACGAYYAAVDGNHVIAGIGLAAAAVAAVA